MVVPDATLTPRGQRINARIDSGELQTYSTPEPSVSRRTAADQAARVAAGDAEAVTAAQSLRDRIAARVQSTVVEPGASSPASLERFPDGYSTPAPELQPAARALPSGVVDLFPRRTPAGASASAPVAGRASAPVEPVLSTDPALPPVWNAATVDARLDPALQTWRAAGIKAPEVQRRLNVFTSFGDALDAAGGDLRAALDGLERPKDRTMVREILGLKAPTVPKVVQRPGEPPIVPGAPEGTQSLRSGKGVDYRGYSTDQLGEEMRRLQARIDVAQEQFAQGQWARENDYGDTIRGMSRSGGRGKAALNQATRLMDAAERELVQRFKGQALSSEEIDAALVRARFGNPGTADVADARPSPVSEYADSGDTSFDFGANVGEAWDDAVAGREPLRAARVDPELAPAASSSLNWRTWFDQQQPGAQSLEQRLRQHVDAQQPTLTAAKGYQSLAAADEEAIALARELMDDPLSLDRQKIRQLAHEGAARGNAGIPILAIKRVVTENTGVMEAASRVLADANASAADVASAQAVFDQASRSTDAALAGIVSEQARLGRGLGTLRLTAKLTADPDYWLVQAKKLAGDAPLSDDLVLSIRRLAREVADTCGGT